MDQIELNRNLKEVIKQAQDIGIPVPADICEEVDINPRPKKRYGCCRLKDGVYYIEVSKFILNCDPEKIRGVIAHEVLHACRGCYNHGNIWKKYAAMLNSAYGYNIKRTSSNEEMGLADADGSRDSAAGRKTGPSSGRAKYIIRCRKCGREYPRQRCSPVVKNPKAYRCRCGGRLTVFEIRRTADLCMKTT